MVANRITQTSGRSRPASASRGALLVRSLAISAGPRSPSRAPVSGDLTRAIGQSLLTTYVLPFRAARRSCSWPPCGRTLLRPAYD